MEGAMTQNKWPGDGDPGSDRELDVERNILDHEGQGLDKQIDFVIPDIPFSPIEEGRKKPKPEK